MLVRTEYSFGTAYGGAEAVMARLPWGGIIADTTCFGHVPFAKAAQKAGRHAVLGWRVRVVPDLDVKKGGAWAEVALVPRTPGGLTALYAAVRRAEEAFHYVPRLSAADLNAALRGGEAWDAVPLAGAPLVEEGPWLTRPIRPSWGTPGSAPAHSPLVFSDNFYPSPADREAWTFACPRARGGIGPGHILSHAELRAEGLPLPDREWLLAHNTPLPRAENIRFPVPDPDAELRAQCESELIRRGLGAEYRARMERELELIGEKRFADYFLVIGDMIRWAKQRMLVGPGRGSSGGSLVCWLTRITELDPLRHGLIFERFVDVNRADLPDIDVDFPDATRHLVVEYLAEKYGQENVAHIGTVLRYKARSALDAVASALHVPDRDLAAVKDVMLERSSGDSRVNDCVADTFEQLDAGRALVARHPGMRLAARLEGAAKTCGTHAAGIIVCNEPVRAYCAVGRGAVAQVEKKGAEALNMLKIDALGLRTLSVIETACEAAGLDRERLYDLDLEDEAAFAVLNDGKFSGIFQFEGLALQNLAQQIRVRCFEDISAIGALARPGPLSSGGAHHWIMRHRGEEPPTPPHPALEPLTRDTYGVIMYQEQVMRITRELAGFSWKETADIRKLMSARQGNESFDRWTGRFMDGCVANGVEAEEADKIWKAINTFGSWAFNKSHSVAYGILSYWCCWLKAHHPLEFALGCLRHARDDESAIKQLRELLREGIGFVPLDRERALESWSIQDGKLYGGLLGVKGIGPVTAAEIVNRRVNGLALKPGHLKLLAGRSVYEDLFPTRTRWAAAYRGEMFQGKVVEIADVHDSDGPPVIILGRLVKKNLRNMNEEKLVVRRGGRRVNGPEQMLMFTIEDDTERMICVVNRFRYAELGAPIIERGAMGQWLAVKGRLNTGFHAFNVDNIRWLEDSEHGQ